MSSGGWYPDPEGGDGRLRWWDGSGWSEHTTARGSAQATTPPEPEPEPRFWQRLRRRADPEPEPVVHDWRLRPGGPQWSAPAVAVEPQSEPAVRAPRRRWYRHPGVIAAVTLILFGGLIAGFASLPDSSSGLGRGLPSARPTGSPPPLALLCGDTQPSTPDPNMPRQPVPAGPRITDPDAKISYAQEGPPFRMWDQGTWGTQSGGGLGEEFTTGQYFITQQVTPDGGPYMTTILSGTVPAAYGDDPHPNIECAARVIADDVRRAYYPNPNQRTDVAARAMTISGRAAYYLEFHLSFDAPGYDAKGEQVAICVIDVPGHKAAALYVSVPDTHKQYRSIIPSLMGSIRVVG